MLLAKRDLEKWIVDAHLTDDEKVGAKILADSFEAPIRKILENAGVDSSMVVGKINEMADGQGYNVITKKYVDMIEDGIIDPAEVVVNEIQNAASVGGLLLTTDCLITDYVEDKNSAAMPSSCPPGGCGGAPGIM